MDRFDVIIIGSGLGGLISGIILSREGFKVCILEKNAQIGGNLQTFQREGVTFDTGMHYLGSMEKGQVLHQYFKYLELSDKLKIEKLDRDAFITVSFEGDEQKYKLAQGYENFNSNLLEFFPNESLAIRDHEQAVKDIINNFPLYKPAEIDSYALNFSIFGQCATDVLKSMSKNPKLLNVIAGGNTLYSGFAHLTPFYVHACVLNSLIDSAWKLIGGSSQIADNLENNLLKYGGTVLRRKEVKEFLIENGKVSSVVTKDGDRFFADNFISNVHPVTTLKMLGDDSIKKYYFRRIMALENTHGAFTVHISLKEKSFPVLNSNFFHYRAGGIFSESTSLSEWPHEFYFYTPSHEFGQQYADSAVLLTYMDFNMLKKWENTSTGNRGVDYIEFKNEFAGKLISFACERFPNLRNSISKYNISTPLTYRDYTGTYRGSAYGILKNCKEPLRSLLLPKTKIPNLYLTGQNLNLHGILGVTMSAVITCSEFTGLKHLTKKISNA